MLIEELNRLYGEANYEFYVGTDPEVGYVLVVLPWYAPPREFAAPTFPALVAQLHTLTPGWRPGGVGLSQPRLCV